MDLQIPPLAGALGEESVESHCVVAVQLRIQSISRCKMRHRDFFSSQPRLEHLQQHLVLIPAMSASKYVLFASAVHHPLSCIMHCCSLPMSLLPGPEALNHPPRTKCRGIEPHGYATPSLHRAGGWSGLFGSSSGYIKKAGEETAVPHYNPSLAGCLG
jgi:hypothetical protein